MIDVGQTVGNYTITAKLGEGGMGTVFLAEHPVIGSKVALKAIHPYYARSPEVVSRFVNEARAVNQIGHDHIIDIHDFGTTPAGDFYFIMEYLNGEMLSDQRGRQVLFSPARALSIAAQIADALAASHERGVIHRDLKPDNIFLITRDGKPDFVKVLDFGLAKLTSTNGAVPVYTTDAGIVMGTPYYMSPEQCQGRAELDHRTDVYSLGVILFEMLTGRVPFAGEGYGEVMTKHISLPPPPARRFVPDLPVAIEAILSRALAKDPGARFQTMTEFRELLLSTESSLSPPLAAFLEHDLERELGREPSGPLPLGTSTSTPMPSELTFQQHLGEVGEVGDLRPSRSRGGLLFLGAAAALTVVALSNGGVRGQASQLFARSAAPKRPTTVRVNFSSDPAGATVSRNDGAVLGVTPLSAEIPYSDRPVDYRLQKEGYTPKVSSFIPNLPSPVFVLLERIEGPAPPPAARSVAPTLPDRPLSEAPSPARVKAAREGRHRLSAERRRDLLDDGDDVMPPSTE
jgi:serine/threonine protein kinase